MRESSCTKKFVATAIANVAKKAQQPNSIGWADVGGWKDSGWLKN
jgi:hypothetical protein